MGMEKYILTNILISENKIKNTVSHHDHPRPQEQEEARTRKCRPWPHWQASKASRRSWKGRRTAPPPDTHGQVPSRVFWKSGHAILPQDAEQVSLPCHQPGRHLVAGERTN